MEQQSTSPLPPDTKVRFDPQALTFPQALDEILKGKKVTKEEWEDENTYGFMEKDKQELWIYIKGKNRPWVISEGDMIGEDYYVIN